MDIKAIYADVLTKELERLGKTSIDELSEQQQADLWNLQNMKASESIAEEAKKLAKESAEELKRDYDTQLSLFKAELQKQASAIGKMGSRIELQGSIKIDDSEKPWRTQVKEALEANREKLNELTRGMNKASVRFSVNILGKAATDPIFQEQGNGTVTGGNVPIEYRRPDFVDQVRRQPFIGDFLNIQSIESTTDGTPNVVTWVEQENIEENTGGTSEGQPKNQMSWKYVVREETAKTRTVFTKVSTRALRRIDQMQGKINNELTRSLLDDYSQQILFGDATGNNLRGLFTIAPLFDGGGLASTVDNANNFDVIRACILQLAVASSGTINGAPQAAGFTGTVVVVNPLAAAQMDLSKGTDGQYVMPPFTTAGGTVIKGLPVVETNHLAADQFIVMDGTRADLYPEQQLTIEIGLDGNDFTNNIRTVLGEHSAALVVPVNYYGAFVQGTFSVARALLETP